MPAEMRTFNCPGYCDVDDACGNDRIVQIHQPGDFLEPAILASRVSTEIQLICPMRSTNNVCIAGVGEKKHGKAVSLPDGVSGKQITCPYVEGLEKQNPR